MANIMEILGRIKTAIYGRDVRQSIYDAILQCYKDATGNPESIAAHTGDTDNPHNVTAAQLGLETAAEDIANAKEDIVKLKTPEFDDFTKEGSAPPDARTAIAALTSKMSIFTAISKIKAALMGLVTLGEMRGLLVNNGLTTEAGKYFLDAAFGKTLADKDAELAELLAQLNSEFTTLTWVDVITTSEIKPTVFRYADYGAFYAVYLRYHEVRIDSIGQVVAQWNVNAYPFRVSHFPYRITIGSDKTDLSGRFSTGLDISNGEIKAYPRIYNQNSGTVSLELYGDALIFLPKS